MEEEQVIQTDLFLPFAIYIVQEGKCLNVHTCVYCPQGGGLVSQYALTGWYPSMQMQAGLQTVRGGAIPACISRWYPSMPCNRYRGVWIPASYLCSQGHVPAPGMCLTDRGVCLCQSVNRAVPASGGGFETQRRRHQKSKTGVSVSPQKRLQTFFKKSESCALPPLCTMRDEETVDHNSHT